MNAEIIAVGTELLLGQIANTNGQFVSKQLASLGVNVYKHTVVGDNKRRIQSSIEEARQHHDLIIFSGGLGPTEDDLTREALSEYLQVPLIYDPSALQHVESFFTSRGKETSEANRKQALVLDGSHVFFNHAGLAAGCALEHDGTLYVLLPGPPQELKTMVKRELEPFLAERNHAGAFFRSRVLRFFGIGESALEETLKDLIHEQTNPTIAPLAGQDEVTLRLTITETDEDRATDRLNKTKNKILERVGEYLYGYNEDSLFSKSVEYLKEKNWSVATAESMTGGGLMQQLTEIAGASSVTAGGMVTYSNEMKIKHLGVNADLLDEHGAVSEACAKQMAEGIRDRYESAVGISITGVAGPDTLENKAVGTLYIGIALPNQTTVYKRKLTGNRETIRRRAAKEACSCLLLEKKKGD
ncbi:molybdopterin binding motif, CinA N-terminal domain [Geomicrobium sp. JCM 19037]|uniref:competence/damage-inducible protein A n=1 Tax=unclassified Geomicrobium TaxID=2628951 RepID=UPI00045F212E|nr:competence/damage-inducible protein A [Geomicrobium sp. JCM 19037]GAK01991.1 molybdopterin binding motif, CinA N-terminal domain [Geomicrobium sp. JCM 19037]